MTKIDIVSGFLGAGKTTLIRKLLQEALQGEKVVLIENEFGEIGIDGGFLKESGVEMKEMNSGCICCSLVGDFGTSLQEVLAAYEPDRILIEPSGVGKLSDVIRAVQNVKTDAAVSMGSAVAVVDASKCRMYVKNFGEFFLNQIAHAGLIILSRTGRISEEKTAQAVELIREHNKNATVITTPWEALDGMQILKAMEEKNDWMEELLEETRRQHEDGEHCHHHHHEGEHGEHCHHHHEGGQEEHCHHHHHEGEHEEHGHSHHEHGPDCTCGCHDHDHHHHHADEVFTSWGKETAAFYSREEIASALSALEDEKTYGLILRAKGMLPDGNGNWTYFDYVPGEMDIREGRADLTGKICVIGAQMKEDKLCELFAR